MFKKTIKTISQQIDKNQTKRNLKTFKTKTCRTKQMTQTRKMKRIQSDSISSSDTADNDSDVSMFKGPSTSAGTTTYFTTQLPGLRDFPLQLAKAMTNCTDCY